MIVCSCNVLSDTQILEALRSEGANRPASPAAVYRCLGCAPRCGRCVSTVRALVAEARLAACNVGCLQCPDNAIQHEPAMAERDDALRIAAE